MDPELPKVLPPVLKPYVIDELLENVNGECDRTVAFCVSSVTQMKNGRMAGLIFDGGSRYPSVIPRLDKPLALCVRCLFLLSSDHVETGALLQGKVSRVTAISSSGERVLVVSEIEKIGSWPDCKEKVQCVGHPLALRVQPEGLQSPTNSAAAAPTGGGRENRAPSGAASNSPLRQAASKNAVDVDTEPTTYAAVRRDSQSDSKRAMPYKAVQRVDEGFTVKIKDLNNYMDRWRIVARVTSKGEIRSWNSNGREGKVFNVDLVDSPEDEIRAAFFGEAVDLFYNVLKVNGVYAFSRGSVRCQDERWRFGTSPFELRFSQDAIVTPVTDQGVRQAIPTLPLSIVPIADIHALKSDAQFDVIGVVTSNQETGQVTIKSTGEQKDRKNVKIGDSSGDQIEFTLWGSRCAKLPEPSDPSLDGKQLFVLVRRAKLDDYQGTRKIKANNEVHTFVFDERSNRWEAEGGSQRGGNENSEGTDERGERGVAGQIEKGGKSMGAGIVAEDVPELVELARWYYEGGGKESHNQGQYTAATASFSARAGDRNGPKSTVAQFIQDAQTEVSGAPDKVLYVNVAASIAAIHVVRGRKYFWKACPKCQKKVMGGSDDQPALDVLNPAAQGKPPSEREPHWCAQCQTEVVPDYKYNLLLDLQDHTDTLKCNAMGDQAVPLVGVPCQAVEQTRFDGVGPNGEEWEDYFQRQRRKEFSFRIMAKKEMYNDEHRMKYRVVGALPLEQYAKDECQQVLGWLRTNGLPEL